MKACASPPSRRCWRSKTRKRPATSCSNFSFPTAEESLRLRIRIAEGFADLGWLVQGHRGGVEKKLPDGFQLDREGHILKLKKPE
jgi:hypothetical protein